MSASTLNRIPEEVRDHVKMLLSVTPNVRPDADQMTKVCTLQNPHHPSYVRLGVRGHTP